MGEKTAAKLLQEYGSLDAVLANAESIPGKLGENLRANTDAALASRVVATIACDVPVEIDLDGRRVRGVRPARVSRPPSRNCASRRCSIECSRCAMGPRAATDGGADGSPGAFARPTADAGEPLASESAPVDSALDAAPSRCPARACVAGPAAFERLGAWVDVADAWLGVAIDDGAGASLFGDERDLAVAHLDATALVDRDRVDEALSLLLSPRARRSRGREGAAPGGVSARRGVAMWPARSRPSTRRASSTSAWRPTCSNRTARPTSSQRCTPTTSASRFRSRPTRPCRWLSCSRRRQPISRSSSTGASTPTAPQR